MSVSRTSRSAPEQDRHLGREEVVVAEGDLVGRGRVVLVDHRDDPPVEQLAQRRAGRSGSACARTCRRRSAAPGPLGTPRSWQQLVVGAVELALPHRRGGLELVHRRRAAPAAPSASCRARSRPEVTRTTPSPSRVARGNLVADAASTSSRTSPRVVGDDAGAELDDDGRMPEGRSALAAVPPASSPVAVFLRQAGTGCGGLGPSRSRTVRTVALSPSTGTS